MYNVCKQRYTNENYLILISYLILFCSELYIPLWVFKLYGYTMTCIYLYVWRTVPSEKSNNMKSKKISHCRNNSKIKYQNRRIGKIDIPSTQLHDRSLSWLATGTSIESGGVKSTENRIPIRDQILLLCYIKST
jgi:hypothetical protein